MICPYIQNYNLCETENILDEEDPNFVKKHVTKQMWTNMECRKEDCAVYRDGVCHYTK